MKRSLIKFARPPERSTGFLNCRGVVRIDFIYNEEARQPFMLEINTIPGQSEASIIPQQVLAMGWTLKEFYTKLVKRL
jgi:D-alanine-D-alanine ligase